MKRTFLLLIVMAAFLSGCGLIRDAKHRMKYGPEQPVDRLAAAHEPGEISFQKDIRPILNRRCAACHGCYDAPCQLKLTSFEGLDRGGSKKMVYNATRLFPVKPTRLFIDAKSTARWREMEFHPVLNERDQTEEVNLENSVLNLMLQLKREHPLPETTPLPPVFDLELDRKQTCATAAEFCDYKKKYPLWGMPYALPGLSDAEHEIMVKWIRQGARMLPRPGMSEKARGIVDEWETFFNGESLKNRLASRYIYEHLFIGHIHFDSLPDREFYRLVRSRTPPGEPVDEINTRRPYDDPGVDEFYYRLRRVESDIVVKNHTVYHMTPGKMDRFRELFLDKEYEVTELPSYDVKIASNPFKAFKELPAISRYKFLLDDALFIVMGFIKGPVCRGQIALNVINDHFFVSFFDPDKDAISNDTAFLARVADHLSLPSEKGASIRVIGIWSKYFNRQQKYLEEKETYLKELNPDNIGNDMSYIWDGDGGNDNALLTVFRHFDSATVTTGFVGQIPKTAWVIDFPLLERIHYLLVAGFDVHGNVGHNISTRLHMDFLRMEGENNFLSFLPKDRREEIRAEWYKGAKADTVNLLTNPFHGLERSTRVVFETDDPKKEFLEKILDHAKAVAGPPDVINRCEGEACLEAIADPRERRVAHALRKIARIKGTPVQIVPDVAFLRIVVDDGENDMIYSVIRNKALSNNSFMFGEERRRIRDDDTITIVKGYIGDYPNAFCRIKFDQIEDAAQKYGELRDKIDYYYFGMDHAVRRTSPDFWEEADRHYRRCLADRPVEGGQFDLNRFERIAEKSDPGFKW